MMSGYTTDLDSCLVHNDFMEACLDEAARKVFDLLPRLHEKIATSRGESDGDTFSSVACPNVEPGVSGTTVDSEAVEICVETCKDCVLLAILCEI